MTKKPPGAIAGAVAELRQLFHAASELKPQLYNDLGDTALRERVVAPLHHALATAEAVLARMEAAADAEILADTCFAACFELRHNHTFLARERHGQDLIVACEAAWRKLRRAIVAVVDVVADLYDSARISSALEVDVAVATRDLYTRFRRSLANCQENDPASVRRALRYVATALAAMFACPTFAEIRIADARLLRGVRSRLVEWARQGMPDATGLALYRDISTTAEILRSVNRRQELQRHDESVLRTFVDDATREHTATTKLDVLSRLCAIQGRSDQLDELLASLREQHTPLSEARLQALVAAARDALSELPVTCAGREAA